MGQMAVKELSSGQYRTWTVDSGLYYGLDSGLNNGLAI